MLKNVSPVLIPPNFADFEVFLCLGRVKKTSKSNVVCREI